MSMDFALGLLTGELLMTVFVIGQLVGWRARRRSMDTTESESLLPGFLNCARHCWCAYAEDAPVIQRLDAAHIVRALKQTPHEHGPGPNGCAGCALETGKMKLV